MNKIKKEYVLNGNERAIILNFLSSTITSRQAGKEIGLSHQGVINLTTNLIRSWIRDGKININIDKIFPDQKNLLPKKFKSKENK